MWFAVEKSKGPVFNDAHGETVMGAARKTLGDTGGPPPLEPFDAEPPEFDLIPGRGMFHVANPP